MSSCLILDCDNCSSEVRQIVVFGEKASENEFCLLLLLLLLTVDAKA